MLARARVGWPRALRELKDLLFTVYLAAGTPSLDEITEDIARDDGLAGAPSRDTVRRVIGEPGLPRQADTVSVATVLARRAAWDESQLTCRVSELWVQAGLAQGVGRPIGEFRDDDKLLLDDLEIHPAFDTGDARDRFGALPAYVRRDHDIRLNAVADAARAGHSGIAVLVGGSSTGKTRALWEAVRRLPPAWRLWHPLSPTRPDAALAELADVAPRTVVWLNEAQHYLGPDPLGERVAACLRDLLRDPSRAPVLVVATLWPDHWDTLTTRNAADRHAQARELLDGHKIDVPDAFTPADLAALGERAGADPRLTEAVSRADDARITQYLAGVPVLTARYAAARGATRALIHAAMDARRLGAGLHIPLAWLADAAPGYLTDTEFRTLADDWLPRALAYVTTACDGIPGILTPARTDTPRNRRRPAAQPPQGPHLLLADYLDQYGRYGRAGTIPPVDFWTAAGHHAHAADRHRLGDTAQNCGLYRDAAQLFKHATAQGDPFAPAFLLSLLQGLGLADARAVPWVTAHAALDNPSVVAWLLEMLEDAGTREQVNAFLARDPATHTTVNGPNDVAPLLKALLEAGARDQVDTLAERAAAHTALDDPYAVGQLLWDLRRVGARDQVNTLLARGPAHHTTLSDPNMVAWLLEALRAAGARDQVDALLARDPATHAVFDDPWAVARLLEALRDAGARDQVNTLLARDPAHHAALDNPNMVGHLLKTLREAGARDQADALGERAAAHATLDDPYAVAWLLGALRKAEAPDQVNSLLARDPARHATLNDPWPVSQLLGALRDAGAQDQVDALLARDPARHAALNDPWAVSWLLKALRDAGAQDQVNALLARDPAHHAALDNPWAVAFLLEALRDAGAQDQVNALLARAPALDDPWGVGQMVEALRDAVAQDQEVTLTERLPAARQFGRFVGIGGTGERFRFGREPDGSPAPAWSWDDLE